MIRHFRDGLDLVPAFFVGSILVLASGCGSGTTQVVSDSKGKEERVQENSLGQIGDLLRLYTEEKGKAPSSAEDLAKYERGFPLGCGKLKRGEIVLIFGAPLQDGASDQIIAYEKQTPESGGHVLMQDGKTIKKMTPDEFKAASKAGKG